MLSALLATGDQFVLFGSDHFLAILVIALVSAACAALLHMTHDHPRVDVFRALVCRGLAAVLVISWLAGEVHALATDTWSLKGSLPLHLCDIGVFLTAATLVGVDQSLARRRAIGGFWQRFYELAYFWGLGGTLQAIITPEVVFRFPDFMSIRFFVTHGGIVVGVLAMTIGLRMRPQPGSPVRVWLLTLALALVVMGIDWLLGVNYMYLMGPPPTPSLFDYFGRWPWSLLTLVFVGTGFIMIWYSPFWIADRLRRMPQR